VSDPFLVDRERELAGLRAVMDRAAAGEGAFAVIEGVNGIGKTQLWRAGRAAARQAGVATASARGTQLEQQHPFGVVRQLLEPALAAADANALSGAAAGAAHVFGPQPSTGGELATMHGLYWLTLNVFSGPAALFVDDLHWADPASLRFLAFLLPRLAESPLAVVATVRTDNVPDGDPLLPVILADSAVTSIRPQPLRAAAVSRLLGELLGVPAQPGFAAACAQATAGNPLLVSALAKTLEQEQIAPVDANIDRVDSVGASAISRQVARQLETLSEPVRRVAETVAILEGCASLPIVAATAGLDVLPAADAIDELTRTGLLDAESEAVAARASRVGRIGRVGRRGASARAGSEDPQIVQVASYRHPMVATAVRVAMGTRARAEAHARAVDVLIRNGSSPESIAAHLLLVPPGIVDSAVPLLRAAADNAASRGAPESVYTFLDRCLAEEMAAPDRLAILEQAADAAVQFDLDAAARLLTQAVALAGPDHVARLNAKLGVAEGFLRHPEAALAALRTALAATPAEDSDARRRLEAALLVGAVIIPGQSAITDRLPELAQAATLDTVGGRMLAAALSIHELARADPGGRSRAHDAIADGVLVEQANGEGALVCGWITLLAADDPLAMVSLNDAVQQALSHGSQRALAAAYTFRALGLLWHGRLLDAESDAREALRLANTGRVDLDRSVAGGYLADALLEQGRLAEAEQVLREVTGRRARPDYYARDALARLRRRQGRTADAIAAAVAAGQAWAEYGYLNAPVGGWRSEAALALFAAGDPDAAGQWSATDLELARRWGAPRALGRALRVQGQLSGRAEGLARLAESVEVLRPSTARLELARSLVELGAAQRRAGQRAEARDALTEALDLAEVCGAAPLVEQARTELRAAGYRPRRDSLTGPTSLTPSEQRVAELAAAGAANREIAQALFVTVKTVEVHLTNVYRKLGVNRRRDLVDALPT
jgi:DNA-binding CsgD family transcriptional regulator